MSIWNNLPKFILFEFMVLNEDDTHKLSWKKERTIWKGIIEKLKNYNPIWAKHEQVDKVFKGNVISEI